MRISSTWNTVGLAGIQESASSKLPGNMEPQPKKDMNYVFSWIFWAIGIRTISEKLWSLTDFGIPGGLPRASGGGEPVGFTQQWGVGFMSSSKDAVDTSLSAVEMNDLH